jgi:ribosomal RNA-processing protein 1
MRCMLRKTFEYMSVKKWEQELVNAFNKMMLSLPLNINDHKVPDGIGYHLADIYLEELGKFGETLKPVRSVKMLQPFVELLAISTK